MHMEYQNLFGLKKDNPEKLPESNDSSKFVLYSARMSGEVDSRKDSQPTKFEGQQSFRELCHS